MSLSCAERVLSGNEIEKEEHGCGGHCDGDNQEHQCRGDGSCEHPCAGHRSSEETDEG